MRDVVIAVSGLNNIKFYRSFQEAEINIEHYDKDEFGFYDSDGNRLRVDIVRCIERQKAFGFIPFTADYKKIKIYPYTGKPDASRQNALKLLLTRHFHDVGRGNQISEDITLHELIALGLARENQ